MKVELFWSKVEKTTHCWNWNAAKDRDGYGVWSIRVLGIPKQYRAHRISYLLANGQINDMLTIDHLCKNKGCVNPEHMEEVSVAENIKRSSSYNGLKTHCKNGHKFTEENTYLEKTRKHRHCKKCRSITESKRYNKLKVSK